MADNRNVLAVNFFFLSFVPLTAVFQCQGLLFCTLLQLLIERSHQRQLTLKAALKYNAVLAPRLTSDVNASMRFLKKRMKSWLSQGSSVSRDTLPPCKQALKHSHFVGLCNLNSPIYCACVSIISPHA